MVEDGDREHCCVSALDGRDEQDRRAILNLHEVIGHHAEGGSRRPCNGPADSGAQGV